MKVAWDGRDGAFEELGQKLHGRSFARPVRDVDAPSYPRPQRRCPRRQRRRGVVASRRSMAHQALAQLGVLPASLLLLSACGSRTGLDATRTSPSATVEAGTAVDGAPVGDAGMASAVLFGGYNDPTPAADIWRFDGTAWTELQVAGPSPRDSAVMASLQGTLVLFGGEASSSTLPTSLLWTFDGSAWTSLAVPNPPPRTNAVMAPLGDVLVLFGGLSDAGFPLSDTWTFDGTRWTDLFVPGPPGLSSAVMASLNGKLVLVGVPDTVAAHTWTFDGAEWTDLGVASPSGLSAVERAVMAPLGGQLVLVTGDNNPEADRPRPGRSTGAAGRSSTSPAHRGVRMPSWLRSAVSWCSSGASTTATPRSATRGPSTAPRGPS